MTAASGPESLNTTSFEAKGLEGLLLDPSFCCPVGQHPRSGGRLRMPSAAERANHDSGAAC